jgi:hypothetical protein
MFATADDDRAREGRLMENLPPEPKPKNAVIGSLPLTELMGREVTFCVTIAGWSEAGPTVVYVNAVPWQSDEDIEMGNRWKADERKRENVNRQYRVPSPSIIGPDVVQLTGQIVSVFHDCLHVENGISELKLDKVRLVEGGDGPVAHHRLVCSSRRGPGRGFVAFGSSSRR